MVKPIRSLLLLFYVACIVGVIMILSPKELPISESISMKVFSLDEIAPPKIDTTQADISNVLALQEKLEKLENPKTTIPKAKEEKQDLQEQTYTNGQEYTSDRREPSASDTSKRIEKYEDTPNPEFPIQYADENNDALVPFFESLQRNQLLRIVHYGDSQLEGDRVTSYLRKRMQQRFGGCGVGLVPLLEKQSIRSTLSTRNASNISRYSVLDSRRNRPRYGLLGSYFRFAASDSLRTSKTWLTFSKTAYDEGELPTKIENIKFVYTSNRAIRTQLKIDKDTVIRTDLRFRPEVSYQEIGFKTTFKQIQINLETEGNPEFYGIAFDCDQGVAVDNVALRGMSVIDFSKTSRDFLASQLENMNVKLIILQFGVNVVPNPVRNYDFYEKMFYNQLKYLKSVAPDVSVLVVGVSDMARRSGTGYASYPNVTLIRNAQKNAAFKAGCAFWDLYQAMGGANSMVKWVKTKPSLANTDYTHFNARGAKLVGEMIYNALMKEYENYKQQNQ